MVDNVIVMSCEDRRGLSRETANNAYQILRSKTCVVIDRHNARRTPRQRSVWANYRDCLRQALTLGGEWSLIMQDDIYLHPTTRAAIAKIIETCPDEDVVSLFHLTNKFYNTAIEAGHNVVRSYAYTYSVAMLWRRSAIEDILKNERYCDIGRHDDANIRRWSYNRQKPIPTVIPSFVQHDDLLPSTLGNGVGRYKGKRMSNSYDPRQSIVEIDWSKAFATAYVDQSAPTYLKEETSDERFARFVQERKWTWAKSYAKKAPHWWTLRQDTNDKDFWAAVLHIEIYGYDKTFWRRTFRYYDHEEHHYWVNDAGHPDTIIINRTLIDQGELARVQQELIEAGNVT